MRASWNGHLLTNRLKERLMTNFVKECAHCESNISEKLINQSAALWEQLQEDGLTVAVYTVLEQDETLAVHTAVRQGDTLRICTYNNPTVSGSKDKHNVCRDAKKGCSGANAELPKQIGLLSRQLSEQLSPADYLCDMTKQEFQRIEPDEAEQLIRDQDTALANAEWDDKCSQWKVPVIPLHIVGHSLQHSVGRIWGREFYQQLRESDIQLTAEYGTPKLEYRSSGLFSSSSPPVQYIRTSDDRVFGISVKFTDINLQLEEAPLRDMAETLLGIDKLPELPYGIRDELQDDPDRVYVDAYRNVMQILLCHEAIGRYIGEVAGNLGITEPIRPSRTIGGTAYQLLQQFIRNAIGVQSNLLREPGAMNNLSQGG